VRTWENGSDATDFTEDTRTILAYQTAWEFDGTLSPDGSGSDAEFAIEAELISYDQYGQLPDCVRTWNATGDGENITTFSDFCEVTSTSDDYPSTDYAEIAGSFNPFHDIRISRMGVYQGYNTDGSGVVTNFVESISSADLNVGFSRVYAEVQHRGSDPQVAYAWNVSYTFYEDGAVVASGVVSQCMNGIDNPYSYMPLGGMNPGIGVVCVELELVPADYEFMFEVNMYDRDDNINMTTGATDMRPSNNDETMSTTVVNNLPMIILYELVNTEELVVGQSANLEIAVSAFDVDDPSGSSLQYSYTNSGQNLAGCGGTFQMGGTLCSVPINPEWVGNFVVSIEVSDAHGGSSSVELMLDIWNAQVGSISGLTSGIGVSYPITYFGTSNFTLAGTDGDLTSHADKTLTGFSGKYSAVAVIDYSPSTTYSAADILDQSVTFTVPKLFEVILVWYFDGSRYTMMSNDAQEVDASKDSFTYDIPANSPVIPAGQFVFFGGQLAQESAPTASVSGFSAIPA